MSVAKDKKFWMILLLFIVILASSNIIRMKTNGGLLGEESYYNLRLAETIQEKGIISMDEYSYGSRPLTSERGYPFILSVAPLFLSSWLPLLLGLLSFIFFYLILKELKAEIAWIAGLLLISSPSIIYLYTASTKHSIAVTLVLLGSYLYLKKEHIKALFTFALLPFFSIGATILIGLLSWYLYKKRKINNVQFATLNILYVLLILILYQFLFTLGLPEILQFSVKEFGIMFFKQGLLAEAGGLFGLGTFLILLGFCGIYVRWQDKFKYVFVFVFAAIIAVVSIYFPFMLFYTTFVLAGLGAYALLWLWEREWKNKNLRTLILIVILCGLIFSPLSYINRVGELGPSSAELEAVNFLRSQSGEDVVLSSYENGVLINYGRKQNVMDSKFLYAPQVNSRWEDLQRLFHTNDPGEAVEILNNYGVTYIYIDKEMREEIWSSGEREFLFIVRYSSKLFDKLYENEEAEIYLVY